MSRSFRLLEPTPAFSRLLRPCTMLLCGLGITLVGINAAATCNPTGNWNTLTICTPTANASLSNPVLLEAATNSYNTVQAFLVYVDNVLEYEDHSGIKSISTYLPMLSPGPHHIVVQYYNGGWVFASEYITILQDIACSPTATDNTVRICTPAPTARVSNPALVQAAANSSANVQKFVVYIDNVLVFEDTSGSKSISTTLPTLTPGLHFLVVQYYNGSWIVASEYITVLGNTCIPSGSANTATICAPAASASVLNQVLVQAAANSVSKVQKFLVYVDNQLVYQNISGATSISTLLPQLALGNHYLVVQYYNGAWVFASEVLNVISPGKIAVTTYHNDNTRLGANINETTLKPANVNWQSFGRKYVYAVNAQIYAQPLYVPNLTVNGSSHNIVFIATEFNTVYALDANGNGILWQRQLGTPPDDYDKEGISPILGITGTPVIDVSSSTIYLVSDNYENGRLFRLHALDLTTGNEKFGGPVIVDGAVKGNGWDSVNGIITLEKGCYQRMGLALANNSIYVGFGHCNHGWLFAYNRTTLQQTAILNTTPDGAGGALWGGGAAPAVDASGNIFAISAVDMNDPFSGYNDSFLKLDPKTLAVLDFFKPANEDFLRANDSDLGSGGVIVMPDNPS